MKFEFSAGGVVYKKQNGDKNILILVAQHSQHHGWVFPKGLIGDTIKGEKKEETAIREVKEETGFEAKIIQPLEPVVYWYNFKGEKIKKTVYYYIMEFIGESFEDRDQEMEKVEWLSEDEIEGRLTYPSDKAVWKKAKKIIKGLASSF